MAQDFQKSALQLELKKRYVEAAEDWLRAGQIDKALFNFQRGGRVKRAIDLALEHGLERKAAELYLKAEIYDRAAELFRKIKDHSSAARALRSAGRIADAAQMFQVAEDYPEAARLYESVNDFLKAGELFELGGDLESSARVYERAIEEQVAGKMVGKKDMARVAQVLTKVKNFEKAAEIYLQSQEVSEAVLMFVRMGEVEGAAKLLANCQGDVGHEVLVNIDYEAGDAREFARMFYLARDYPKAARVFERCQEFAKAGYLYEKSQDYQRAAEMYAAAGELGKAAAMFEKAGAYADAGDLYLRVRDLPQAAACFELAADHYQSGRLYFEAERYDKAIELLQKVDEAEPRYLDATRLVAELLRRKGYLDMAVDRYRGAIRGLRCEPHTLEHYYNLACICIEKRSFAEAEELLAGIVRVNFAYEDVAQRLEFVRQALQAAAPDTDGGAGPDEGPPQTAEVGPPPLQPASPEGVRGAPPVASEALLEGAGPRAPVDPSGAAFMVGRMDGFEVFSATPLFAELSLAEMRRFWEHCELRRVEPGSLVLEEGVEGRGLYIIRSGAVNVVKGDEVVVQLHPGEFFGEMALVDREAKTSARIVSASEVFLWFLDRDHFERLLESNDHTALKTYRVFVATLCTRLRRATSDVASLRRG